ncbi:MAG: riboflavin biosynthesis protein RibF [Planctomycetes bacterium]|nr:riboflavin biosynthesis protein RibF [Planctomycetota bacterium]
MALSALHSVTIGNFDGVHRGHQALLARAREVAGPAGTVTTVTFEPHPMRLLRPEAAPQTVQTPSERREMLLSAGASEVRVLQLDRALLDQEASAFIRSLHAELGFQAIVEGPDFRFGKGRKGEMALLRSEGEKSGFRVEVVAPVDVRLADGSTAAASSSLVRWLLSQGRVDDTARVLGRPYGFSGQVVRGDQRGREIGWPTANVDFGERHIPMDGVYAGLATLPDGTRARAAISVGTKPTFGDAERTVEAFLMDRQMPLDRYGWTLRLEFSNWIREQARFDSLEPLLAQMRRDVVRTRELVPQEAMQA